MKQLLVALALVSFNVCADEINLVCEFTHTYDLKDGSTSETIGEASATIHQMSGDKVVVYWLGESRKSFTGSMNDAEVWGVYDWELEASEGRFVQIKETLRLNRYTGKFTIVFDVPSSEKPGGLIHYGDCSAASRKF